MLKKGDSIQVHFDQHSYDWGRFLGYSFIEEDNWIEGFLVYEIPAKQTGDKVQELIKFVPIDAIVEVKRYESL